MRLSECLDCGRTVRHWARGLCENCYKRHLYHDTAENFPRVYLQAVEVAADAALLIDQGFTNRHAVAADLGISWPVLHKALVRAQEQYSPAAGQVLAALSPYRKCRVTIWTPSQRTCLKKARTGDGLCPQHSAERSRLLRAAS